MSTTKKQGSKVVDSWDSSMDVYSLLEDGTILRGKIPIKNDANYTINSAFRSFVEWLDKHDSSEVPDEVMVKISDTAAIEIFNGRLNRDDVPQYLENVQNEFMEKVESAINGTASN